MHLGKELFHKGAYCQLEKVAGSSTIQAQLLHTLKVQQLASTRRIARVVELRLLAEEWMAG